MASGLQVPRGHVKRVQLLTTNAELHLQIVLNFLKSSFIPILSFNHIIETISMSCLNFTYLQV